jgi:hypothetical protein
LALLAQRTVLFALLVLSCGWSGGTRTPAGTYDVGRSRRLLHELERGDPVRLAEGRADLVVLGWVLDDDELLREVSTSYCRTRHEACTPPTGRARVGLGALLRSAAADLRTHGGDVPLAALLAAAADVRDAGDAIHASMHAPGPPEEVGLAARALRPREARATRAFSRTRALALDAGGHRAVVAAALALHDAGEMMPLLAEMDDAFRIHFLARVAPLPCLGVLEDEGATFRDLDARCPGIARDDREAWVARQSLQALVKTRRLLDAPDDPVAVTLRRAGWTARLMEAIEASPVPLPSPSTVRVGSRTIAVPECAARDEWEAVDGAVVFDGDRSYVTRARMLRVVAGALREEGARPPGELAIGPEAVRRAIDVPAGAARVSVELIADASAGAVSVLQLAALLERGAGVIVRLAARGPSGRVQLPGLVSPGPASDAVSRLLVHDGRYTFEHQGTERVTTRVDDLLEAIGELRRTHGAYAVLVLVRGAMSYQELAHLIDQVRGDRNSAKVLVAADGLGTTDAAGRGPAIARSIAEPVVHEGDPLVRGSMPISLIRRVVRGHFAEVRYCYARQLEATPALAGRLAVEIVIAASGSVLSSRVVDSSLADPTAEACIARASSRWAFPSTGAGITIVTYPFTFTPAP